MASDSVASDRWTGVQRGWREDRALEEGSHNQVCISQAGIVAEGLLRRVPYGFEVEAAKGQQRVREAEVELHGESGGHAGAAACDTEARFRGFRGRIAHLPPGAADSSGVSTSEAPCGPRPQVAGHARPLDAP